MWDLTEISFKENNSIQTREEFDVFSDLAS
jgi:hypothetical protein